MKEQHIVSLIKKYKADQDSLNAQLNAPKDHFSLVQKSFEIRPDFQTLEMPETSQEILQTVIFDKISLPARATQAYAALVRSIDQLKKVMILRNEIISLCRTKN